MKIIAICGSPRRGNTEFVLKRILEKAGAFGAKTEIVLLREKRIEFCNGCLSCDSTGECAIRDDMQLIYPELESADLIIFGSPNYFSNVSGMMKNFIDRLNPFYANKKLKDKKTAVIVIGQDGIPSSTKAVNYFEYVSEELQLSLVGDLSLAARNPQDIENSPENIQKIDEFAERLVS